MPDQKPKWLGMIAGAFFVVSGAVITALGLVLAAHGEPAGFFIAGAGILLVMLGLEIVTQSLGSLRPSWWPEHIINMPERK